jgi:excisionase family DNA binding protein
VQVVQAESQSDKSSTKISNIAITKPKGAGITMLEQYEDVLTVTELQEILGIGRNKAYSLLQSGAIPSVRIGKKWRIPKDAVLHYLGQWKNQKS